MRFKINTNDQSKHTEMVNSLTWSMSNEVYSISDDKIMYKWDLSSPVPQKMMELDQYPTDIDFPISKALNDCFALGFVDGTFRLITKLGKTEKSVTDAHKGALIALKWSSDGYSLVTAGEDGQIKIWSKTGNLRSSFVQIESPIYCICWSPDNEQILYCSDKMIQVKPLQAGQKQIQWRAHDGVVLCCDWNASNNLIISGGEDCRFKIWDSYGRLIFTSNPFDYVVNSIRWAPNGEYFAVGAFEIIKLCDKTGWTYSFNKTNVGSLMKLCWSSDSTICAGAGGNGQVLFANVADKIIQKDNWELRLTDENKILVTDLVNESHEELDFKDRYFFYGRVISISMAFGNLLVTSYAKCYIYGDNNWNTPNIFDIKDKDSVSLIIQSPKLFGLIQIQNGVMIYNYDGKLVSNPKISGTKFEYLSNKKIALSQDVLAIVDGSNQKKILFFDVSNGKQLNYQLEHTLEILEINLNQNENLSDRKVVFIDANKDLYISPVHKKDTVKLIFQIKLCAMTDSFIWNDKSDILVALSDDRIYTWYYPNAVYIDRDLQELIKSVKESNDFGRHAQLISFNDTLVTIRRKDGAQITYSTSPYPKILLDFCENGKWEKAIKICRFVKEKTLWAVLSCVSLFYRELNTAEIALAACDFIDKVQYINYMKDLPSEISRNAAISLYFHKYDEALSILLQAKLFYRAIKLNIKLYRWEKALELAITHKTHVDTVIGYRQRYLEKIGKEEWLIKFQKTGHDVKVDWESIKQVIYAEKEREQKLR